MIIFTLPFPLSQIFDTIPPVDYTKLTGYSRTRFWLYLIGIGALFGLYFWAIRLTLPTKTPGHKHVSSYRRVKAGATSTVLSNASPTGLSPSVTLQQPDKDPPAAHIRQTFSDPPVVSGRFIFVSSAILAAILIFSYPLTAIDLFIYAIRTRGWGLYDLQPLATSPEALPASDRWLGLAGEWVDAASPYGPLWEWLSLGAFHLSGGDFLSHLFALKIIGAVAYLGCTWIVYKILTHLHPGWAIVGTIAFAWSPLVLFESIQNAHNDIVMAFLLLAAIWVFVRIDDKTNGYRSALFALLICLLLALSVLIKFVTIIVVPLFLLALAMRQTTWFRRLAAFALYALIVLVLVIVPMIPFWPGPQNWAVLEAGSKAGRSLLALLVLGLRTSLATNSAFDVSRALIMTIFAAIYLYFVWRTFTKLRSDRQPPDSVLIACSAAFFILFWYVLLAAPVFHAWYLLWFLPLAVVLLPETRPITVTHVFSITALLIIPYFETVRVWYPALLRNHFLGHLVGVPLLILPPVLVLLWSIRPSRSSEV